MTKSSPITKLGKLKMPSGKSFSKARHVEFKRAIGGLKPKLLAAHETLLEFAIVVPDPDKEAMHAHRVLQKDYDQLQAYLQAMEMYKRWKWK